MYLIHITKHRELYCNGCGRQSVVNFVEHTMFTTGSGKSYCRDCASEDVYPRANEIEINYYKRMRELFNYLLTEAERLNMDMRVFYKYNSKEAVINFIDLVVSYDDSNITLQEGMSTDKTPIPLLKFEIYKNKGRRKERETQIIIWYGTYELLYYYIQSEFYKMGLGKMERILSH